MQEVVGTACELWREMMTKSEITTLVSCVQTDAWAMAGLILISFEHYITGILFVLFAYVLYRERNK